MTDIRINTNKILNQKLMKVSLLIAFACSSLLAQAQSFITNNGIQIVNSADLFTNGSWTNDAGTSIRNNGIITSSESWVNNGSLDAASSGRFILDYATDKNFTPGGSAINSLIKRGAGTAVVSGNIHITDTLFLNGGVMKLAGANDTLLMKNGSILSASNSAYIEGKFAHQGTGTKLYPIGKEGKYLPLTIYKMQAVQATAVVDTAPAGYSKGGGVEALIDFPYAWKVSEKVSADTAAYIEVSYPNSLPVVANPIVVRSVPGSKYASMGARLIDESTGKVTVKSYSRGLNGLYSVAKGFPTDMVADSLALVALFNSTAGSTWKTKTNWLVKPHPVSEWFGVTVVGQSITAINLSGNNLTGVVGEPLVDILSLQTINLSDNQITSIPAFVENPEIATLNVSGNKLEFGALEANTGLLDPAITFNYTNQADLGLPKDTLVDVGTPFKFKAETKGENNSYQWKRNGVAVTGATAKDFNIEAVGRTNMGEYVCEVSNSLFPGLVLKTAKQKALATAKLSGKLFAKTDNAAAKGIMTLFKVNETGKYDTTAVKNIASDGSYVFEKIIVDDYQLMGFVDTLTYARALPTYYSKNTPYWEEAETVAVNSNLDNLNVISQYVPTAGEKGVGIISGYFYEDVPEGGRIEKPKRVSGAGASVRVVENAARPLGVRLRLVAYVFTNDDGEFEMPELPKGEYRLNIQYPGYPMDETTYTTIIIGDGLKSQERVAARVEDNKIKVEKIAITGLEELPGINVQVYPNPSADYVTVRFVQTSSSRSLELLNMNGMKVAEQSANEKENSMNVRQYSSGIYLLHVKDNGRVLKTVRVLMD